MTKSTDAAAEPIKAVAQKRPETDRISLKPSFRLNTSSSQQCQARRNTLFMGMGRFPMPV